MVVCRRFVDTGMYWYHVWLEMLSCCGKVLIDSGYCPCVGDREELGYHIVEAAGRMSSSKNRGINVCCDCRWLVVGLAWVGTIRKIFMESLTHVSQ